MSGLQCIKLCNIFLNIEYDPILDNSSHGDSNNADKALDVSNAPLKDVANESEKMDQDGTSPIYGLDQASDNAVRASF
jgi:hypothetical protein